MDYKIVFCEREVGLLNLEENHKIFFWLHVKFKAGLKR